MCSIRLQNPAHPLLLRGRGFDDLEIINVSLEILNKFYNSNSW